MSKGKQEEDPGEDLLGSAVFSKKEALSYIERAFILSGASPGETILIHISGEEQNLSRDLFQTKAREMGFSIRFLAADWSLANDDLKDLLKDIENDRSPFVWIHLASSDDTPLASGDFSKAEDSLKDYFAGRRNISKIEVSPQDIKSYIKRLDLLGTAKARVEKLVLGPQKMSDVVLPWPNARWAERIFFDAKNPRKEMVHLFEKIVFLDDEKGLARQIAKLEARKSYLNALLRDGYRHLDIKRKSAGDDFDSGVDLSFEIAPGSIFISGIERRKDGKLFFSNIPTDEVYATPLLGSVQGHFATTRPLLIQEGGKEYIIEGIRGELKDGKLINLKTRKSKDIEILEKYKYFSDKSYPATDVLGEIGLVDGGGLLSGIVDESGNPRLFYSTVFDENASLHIGFGKSYRNKTGGEGDVSPHQGSAHIDLVVGDQKTQVILRRGDDRVLLIENGLWVEDIPPL